MSNDSNPVAEANPYAENAAHDPGFDAPPDVCPTGVTVMGVLCVLAGILGLLAGLIVSAQLFIGNQFANSMAPAGAAGAPQREMSAAIDALTSRFMIPHILVGIGALMLACCLLAGGIAVFQRKSWVPKWLRRTFMTLILFEIIRQCLYVILQIEMYPIMERYLTQIGSGPSPPGGKAMMESVQKVSMVVGLAFAIVWAVTKIVLFVLGYRYCGKPHVLAYFSASKKSTDA